MTPVVGDHHIVDLIGGFAVAAVSISILRMLTDGDRWHNPSSRSTPALLRRPALPSALRAVTLGISAFFVCLALRAARLLYTTQLPVDFLSYWAASRLLLAGRPAAAYDVQVHQAVETLAAAIHGLLPFAYPPPYMLLIAPFGLAPYWLAFAIWLATTTMLYVLAVESVRRADVALAHPAVLANFLIGQNGFLTTSIIGASFRLLSPRPYLAGAGFGLMIIKPQLALAIPFALLAGREWKAIAGAVVSSSCALLIALFALGPNSYRGFVASLPLLGTGLAGGAWRSNELASVFALLQFCGVHERSALIAQALVAIAAIALTCRAWWLGDEAKAPILVAATLLISPYLFTYDALLLAIPMLWIAERTRQLWAVAMCWGLCLLPIAGYFGFYSGPNTVPIAAMVCMAILIGFSDPETDTMCIDGARERDTAKPSRIERHEGFVAPWLHS